MDVGQPETDIWTPRPRHVARPLRFLIQAQAIDTGLTGLTERKNETLQLVVNDPYMVLRPGGPVCEESQG